MQDIGSSLLSLVVIVANWSRVSHIFFVGPRDRGLGEHHTMHMGSCAGTS